MRDTYMLVSWSKLLCDIADWKIWWNIYCIIHLYVHVGIYWYDADMSPPKITIPLYTGNYVRRAFQDDDDPCSQRVILHPNTGVHMHGSTWDFHVPVCQSLTLLYIFDSKAMQAVGYVLTENEYRNTLVDKYRSFASNSSTQQWGIKNNGCEYEKYAT